MQSLTARRLGSRLLVILLIITVIAATALLLIAREAAQTAHQQQMADARAHVSERTRSLNQHWNQTAYAIAQQIELWLTGDASAPRDVRDARLVALMVSILDQGDFAHVLVRASDGAVLFRHGTRSQAPPPAVSDAAGAAWVYSDSDRLLYRAVTGPIRFGEQPARITLYVPMTRAILARITYPRNHLALMRGDQVLAVDGPSLATILPEDLGKLTLPWDAEPGAPLLRIERHIAQPLSTASLLAIVAGCATTLVVLGWFVLGRWIRAQVQRLHVMQQAAAEFAASPTATPEMARHLDELADDRDDIGLLALELRELMQRIERSQVAQAEARTALADLNASLEQRVAERTRELELARDAALAASQAKERFLSTMSHEIRTPMTGMLGALELLSRMELSDPQARYVAMAATSGEALLAIINEVLDYAKIDAGRLQLAREPIDVNAVARSVTTLFAAAAQRRAISLRLEADAQLSDWRIGDALHLRQVLMNLVGNALKFTQHGEVVLRTKVVTRDGIERVRFEVSDTGPGIPAAQHERIFEAFVQADPASGTAQSGTGLGLAISRQLVHAMGGDLQVDSCAGKGATFHFELELARAPGGGAPPVATPAPRDAAGLQGRVLLVEDNTVNLLIGTTMLESIGLDVLTAENGERALEVLERNDVSLVLMDCQMPVLDGYEATYRLREHERLHGRPRTPVVALTANALSSDVERCRAAGMDAHLGKPFTVEQLRSAVAAWVPAARSA